MTRQAVALIIFLAACGAPEDTKIDSSGTPLRPAVTAPTQSANADWRARVAADIADLRTSDPALLAELSAAPPQRTRAGILRFTSTQSADPRVTSVFLDRLSRGGGSVSERAALGEVLARTTGTYDDALVDLFAAERDATVRASFVHSAKRASSEHGVTVIQRGLADGVPTHPCRAGRHTPVIRQGPN